MPTKLTGNANCPLTNENRLAKECVAKYIAAETCKAGGGRWTKFITNIAEKTAGVLSTCHGEGDMKIARGIPYEPHKLSQGADQKQQYVLLHKPPDVIYAPSTVVNHNGINMEGKFSSYKWKVPCFPSNTTQRCVIRLRWDKLHKVPRIWLSGHATSINAFVQMSAVTLTTLAKAANGAFVCSNSNY